MMILSLAVLRECFFDLTLFRRCRNVPLLVKERDAAQRQGEVNFLCQICHAV